MKQNRKESGFTLLELLLVVGVGALLIIGGIATYRVVVEGTRVNEATRLLSLIKSESIQLYQGQPNYANITVDQLEQIGAITSQRNPFGGALDVVVNPGDPLFFDVTMEDIPSTACMKVARAITNPAEVENIEIDGNDITADDLTGIADGTYNLILNLTNFCGEGQLVNVVWTFR